MADMNYEPDVDQMKAPHVVGSANVAVVPARLTPTKSIFNPQNTKLRHTDEA